MTRVRKAVIVGVVYAELFRGARTESEARNLEADLDGRLFLTLIESPGEELENFFLNYKFKAIRSHSSALR